jgi:hypothetical protein
MPKFYYGSTKLKVQKQYPSSPKTIRIANTITFPVKRSELIDTYGWQYTNRAIRHLRLTRTIYFVNGVYEEASLGQHEAGISENPICETVRHGI